MSGQQQAILGLVRMATSGGGARIRGTADSGFTTVRPRFSLLMSSIDRPLLKPADHSRITPIRLSLDPVGQLDHGARPHPGGDEAGAVHGDSHMDHPQRHPHPRHGCGPRRPVDSLGYCDARRTNPRGRYQRGYGSSQAVRTSCLCHRPATSPTPTEPMAQIMSALLRRAGGEDMTLGEILTKAYFITDEYFENETIKEFRRLGMRYGMKCVGPDLYVARRYPRLAGLLDRTAYETIDIDEYLRNLPGASTPKTENGNIQTVYAGGQARKALKIPSATLSRMGLFGGLAPRAVGV